jgi:hypothetical protein
VGGLGHVVQDFAAVVWFRFCQLMFALLVVFRTSGRGVMHDADAPDRCPRCHAKSPPVRIGRDGRESMFGEWTCAVCGDTVSPPVPAR